MRLNQNNYEGIRQNGEAVLVVEGGVSDEVDAYLQPYSDLNQSPRSHSIAPTDCQ